MNKESLDRILSGQASPQEEHRLARLLRHDEQAAAWMTEDLTEDFDRIVAARQGRPGRHARLIRLRRVAVAASVVFVLALGGIVYWQSDSIQSAATPIPSSGEVTNIASVSAAMPAHHDQESQPPASLPERKAKIADRQPKTRKVAVKQVQPAVAAERPAPKATDADSLAFYLAQVERCLDEVSESICIERAEEIIRADARLQVLVNKIYLNQFEKQQKNEEALYLKY